jgi:hypothetical protein
LLISCPFDRTDSGPLRDLPLSSSGAGPRSAPRPDVDDTHSLGGLIDGVEHAIDVPVDDAQEKRSFKLRLTPVTSNVSLRLELVSRTTSPIRFCASVIYKLVPAVAFGVYVHLILNDQRGRALFD